MHAFALDHCLAPQPFPHAAAAQLAPGLDRAQVRLRAVTAGGSDGYTLPVQLAVLAQHAGAAKLQAWLARYAYCFVPAALPKEGSGAVKQERRPAVKREADEAADAADASELAPALGGAAGAKRVKSKHGGEAAGECVRCWQGRGGRGWAVHDGATAAPEPAISQAACSRCAHVGHPLCNSGLAAAPDCRLQSWPPHWCWSRKRKTGVKGRPQGRQASTGCLPRPTWGARCGSTDACMCAHCALRCRTSSKKQGVPLPKHAASVARMRGLAFR